MNIVKDWLEGDAWQRPEANSMDHIRIKTKGKHKDDSKIKSKGYI